jgi:hypothetical protein
MNRHQALTAAAALLGCLALAGPAVASDTQGGASALGTHLRYRTVTWTGGGADMSVMAPRGWPLVVTPEGQARFNAPTRPDVLTMGYRGDGSLRRQLRRTVAALQGTPGLRILEVHAHGRGATVNGELRYLWKPQGGGTRFVDYHYLGNDAYAVAGRMIDRKGLKAVLETASRTGECS